MEFQLTLKTSEKNPDPIFSQLKSSKRLRAATAYLSASHEELGTQLDMDREYFLALPVAEVVGPAYLIPVPWCTMWEDEYVEAALVCSREWRQL